MLPEPSDEALIIAPPSVAGQRSGGKWKRVGGAFASAGRVIGRCAQKVGQGAANAYHAIDPDVRRHVAEMPLVGLSMLMPRQRTVQALPDDGYRPVIFVHGLGGRSGNFVAIKAYFAHRQRTRCYNFDFDPSSSIEALAEQLAALIDAVLIQNGLDAAAQVDIVAHSMGGIVARLAVEDASVASRVATIVTLGTPHAGTYLARLASTRLILNLRPNSEVMQRLANALPWKEAEGLPRLVAIWSEADMMILPAEGARVAGAYNIHLDGFSHYGFLIRPRGWRAVYEALADPARAT